MRQCLVLCSIAALAAAQLQCKGTDGEDRCADAGAAAATQRFKIDINVDGEPRPLGFLRGDDLNGRAAVGRGAIHRRRGRRTDVGEADAYKSGGGARFRWRGAGLPGARVRAQMETPASLAAFTRRAVHIAGPAGASSSQWRRAATRPSRGPWARGLDAVNVSHLVAALDAVALAAPAPLGGHVVPVYDDAMD